METWTGCTEPKKAEDTGPDRARPEKPPELSAESDPARLDAKKEPADGGKL